MTIVDARAVSYEQMAGFLSSGGLKVSTDGSPESNIQNHNSIWIISITDFDLPKLISDSEKSISLVFSDVEPMNVKTGPKFVPEEGSVYMTEDHAKKTVDFIEKAQASPETILMLVNCKHGMCRSGAVVDFIGNVCGLGYWNTKRRNPKIVPNHWNQYLLFQEHFKRKLVTGL